MKILWRKLSRIHTVDRILVVRARDVREENFRERADIREIHKSFLPRKFPAIRYVIKLRDLSDANTTATLAVLQLRNMIAQLFLLRQYSNLAEGYN